MNLRTIASSSSFAASVLLCLLTSCDSPRMVPRGADNLELHTGPLRQARPVEIAVLPVQNNTGNEAAPVDAIRSAFHRGLVRQRYTPLALEFVDSKIVEAAYTPGDASEDGILQVFVTQWDESRWSSSAELRVDGEIYLFSVADPDPSKALWGGKFSRRTNVLARRQLVASDNELRIEALQQLADDVLASLPARDPEQVE